MSAQHDDEHRVEGTYSSSIHMTVPLSKGERSFGPQGDPPWRSIAILLGWTLGGLLAGIFVHLAQVSG